MARWLSFFSEYNFMVHYKPGKMNILGDALSRRPDYESAHETNKSSAETNKITVIESCLKNDIQTAFENDFHYKALIDFFVTRGEAKSLSSAMRAQQHRYYYDDGLLWYRVDTNDPPRIMIPSNIALRDKILYEYHNTPFRGHSGRKKTYMALSAYYWWPNMYKSVKKYVKTCEVCQRINISNTSKDPLKSMPIPHGCWKPISMDFLFA